MEKKTNIYNKKNNNNKNMLNNYYLIEEKLNFEFSIIWIFYKEWEEKNIGEIKLEIRKNI